MADTAETSKLKPEPKTFRHQSLAPGEYYLDLSVVQDALVKVNGEPSTFVEAYRKLRDSKVTEVPEFGWTRYETDSGEIVLGGDSGLLSAMKVLIALTQKGVETPSSR